jgi:hypothetical protein
MVMATIMTITIIEATRRSNDVAPKLPASAQAP